MLKDSYNNIMLKNNGCRFEKLLITTGVPQGLVLGPFLFSIYINDLPLWSKVFDMIMYADDMTLYCDTHGATNVSIYLIQNVNYISLQMSKIISIIYKL